MAVVGAGAAGLVAARELRDEGHDVVVFEKGGEVGGVWVFDPSQESDTLGVDESRTKVHSSMYASLRTNLPREVMAYNDFPFTGTHAGDNRRFCGHAEVQGYLASFARHFGLRPLIRFNTELLAATPQQGSAGVETENEMEQTQNKWGPRWKVESAQVGAAAGESVEEVFDALVVCNGHYSEPRVPKFEGAESFPGIQMHAHSYRSPDDFAGKKVLLVGAAASGEDISREIASVADAVYLSARSWQNPEWAKPGQSPVGPRGNLWRRPNVAQLQPDGTVKFVDGTVTEDKIDAVVYCTGYRYHFPFLEGTGAVEVNDNCVSPLFEHIFPPALAPSLSFIGLPWKVVPFPQFELQARWIARALSGASSLPSQGEMDSAVDAFERTLEPIGSTPRRHAHQLGDEQFAYNDRLAEYCGCDSLPAWRASMYRATGKNKRANPEEYRSAHWQDLELREVARTEAVEMGFEVAEAPVDVIV